MWMDLEIIMWNLKQIIQVSLFTKQKNRLTDRENKHGYQWGMGGE